MGVRLLVVDDDLDVLSSLARLLKGMCELELAGSFEAARLALPGLPIAGIIADLRLPDGDGLTFIEEARRSALRRLPGLLIAGHLEPTIAAKAFAMDVTFLLKPAMPENITAFGRRCLAHRSGPLQRLDALADDWQDRYHLTATERELLVATGRGMSREELLESRGIAETTLKRHVTHLLVKTGEASLDRAALRLLRELLRDLE